MIIVDEIGIWDASNTVPTVLVNDALPEEKEFQIWNDGFVPFVDIYDVREPPRRRVIVF